MPLPGFDAVMLDADSRRQGVSVAVMGAHDPTVLEALAEAGIRGWTRPILFGPAAEIQATARSCRLSLEDMEIVDAAVAEIAPAAVAAVRSGRASLLMKGRIATPTLMKAVLDHEHGLRIGRVVCQIVLMEVPRDDRRFLLADTGVTLRPPREKRIEIMRHALDVARALGLAEARVALMAASETVNVTMPETVGASLIIDRARAGEFAPAVVEGPLTFDLAYSPRAVARKHLENQVHGCSDVMIFPDLLSANLTVKAIMYTADCHFGGVLMGLSIPTVFMSRADDAKTRIHSLALALAILHDKGPAPSDSCSPQTQPEPTPCPDQE